MKNLKSPRALGALLAFAASATLLAQAQPPQTQQQTPTIRRSIELVRQHVIARDRTGRFVPDLKKEEFVIVEDGVIQEIATMTLSNGGRIFNIAAPPPVETPEGIILPQTRPASDISGRIFIIFIDDQHLDFRNTARIRQLLTSISNQLIHEGDMFGIVSTGPSSIAVDLTYDRNRLTESIKKVSGNAMKPSEIMQAPEGSQGIGEIRHRAHVAFSTLNDILKKLEAVTDRRKAVIYISNGYDFNPFPEYRRTDDREWLSSMRINSQSQDSGIDPFENEYSQQNQFSEADLAMELSYLTRAANRANTVLYTIDPRGLVGGPDIDENINPTEWAAHVRKTTDSLQVLAELTGGVAAVNSNDMKKALQRIDNESSDYYIIGYYSSNPDPTKRTRQIEIKSTRPGLSLDYRSQYTLKPLPKAKR